MARLLRACLLGDLYDTVLANIRCRFLDRDDLLIDRDLDRGLDRGLDHDIDRDNSLSDELRD